MSVMLGNYKVEDIENRLTDEERNTLSSMQQDATSEIANNEWHCFDIPFTILCGSYETALSVHNILKKYEDEMNDRIDIAVERND